MSLARSLSPTRCLACVLTLMQMLLLVNGTTYAQEPLPEAVIAFRINVAQLLEDDVLTEVQQVAVDASDGALRELLGVVNHVSSITGQVAAPAEISPDGLNGMHYFISLNFSTPEAAHQEYQSLPEFHDVTIGGKAYKQAGGEFGTPVALARLNQSSIDIGSKAYITSGKLNFATAELIAAYRALPKSPVRIAADFDAARQVVNQGVAMLVADADPVSKEVIRLLRHVKTLRVHVDPGAETMLGMTATTSDGDQAAAIKTKLDALIGLGRSNIAEVSIQPVKELGGALLNGISTTAEGTTADLRVAKPKGWEELIASALGEAQRNAKRVKDLNQVKMMGIAVHNFHDTYQVFPFARMKDQPIHRDLSWRAALLPYIGQEALWNQLDRTAGWDSPANKEVSAQAVPAFQLSNGSGMSWIQAERPPRRFRDILDGTSNTIMLIEDPNAGKTPWAEPKHLTIEQAIRLVKSQPDGKPLIAALYDGSVRYISNKIDENTLRCLFDHNDRQPIDAAQLRGTPNPN